MTYLSEYSTSINEPEQFWLEKSHALPWFTSPPAALSINSDNLATVADLKNHLASKDENWQQVFANSALLSAVNHDMVSSEQAIKAGDEVAFFPPVTGG